MAAVPEEVKQNEVECALSQALTVHSERISVLRDILCQLNARLSRTVLLEPQPVKAAEGKEPCDLRSPLRADLEHETGRVNDLIEIVTDIIDRLEA